MPRILARLDSAGRVLAAPPPAPAYFNPKAPLYVRRQVLNAQDIIRWAKDAGFKTTQPPEAMHVTCCFSKKPVDWVKLGVRSPKEPLLIYASMNRTVMPLGDKGAVVLQFPSPVLEERWRWFVEQGASWDYDSYHPHITISYAGAPDLSILPPYGGPIQLGPEIFEPIVEDWEKGVTELAQKATFASMKSRLDALEARSRDALRGALEECRDALVARVRRSGNLDKLVREMKRLPRFRAVEVEMRAMLDRAWEAGARDARREVREERQRLRSQPVKKLAGTDDSFSPAAALRWLRAHSFWISGILGERVVNDAKRVILSGMKNGTATMVIAEELLATFLPWLGNPNIIADEKQLEPYRLETIVRTNTTTAYNHGRLTEFMDEDVIDFLTGIRYTAILDERTTEVCRFLDGKIFRTGEIEGLLPPNHFNCRSVVVPVVVGETVQEGEFISAREIGIARSLADASFLSANADAWKAYREQEDE